MPPNIMSDIPAGLEYIDDAGEAHSLTTNFVGGSGITISDDVNSGYMEISTEPTPPDWRERAYVLKDSLGRPVGIYKGPVDDNVTAHFTLYQPDQGECPMIPLEPTLLDPMDFDTQVAFETLPILEVSRYASGGVLLKFPD
jgi:hypothetical protein